jgi:fatty-acyl-CoA synthase
MNLADIVRYWAGQKPDAISITTDHDTTWSELEKYSDDLARGLSAEGVASGDRVAIFARNCLEYSVAMIATLKLGAIFVPINERLQVNEVVTILKDSACKLIIVGAHFSKTATEAVSLLDVQVSTKIYYIEGSGEANEMSSLRHLLIADGDLPTPSIESGDVALILYTSGTTGFPKGAMLTHGNLLSMSYARILASAMTQFDVGYLPFSMSFAGGIAGVYMPHYVVGAKIVIHPEYDPLVAVKTLERYRVSVFSAVPIIWEQMIRHPDFETHDLSSLRCCFSGGAPVPRSLMQDLQTAGLPMAQAYGITEACALGAILDPRDATRKIGSAGLPIMHSQLKVVDSDLNEVSRGQIGELLIRGPQVMKGYWNAKEATEKTLVNGWLRSGDLATMDEEGYVTIIDRMKDMIISGGLNIYPAEIEKVIAGIEHVLEVAVIGVPDSKWGEISVAVIYANKQLSVEEINAVCSDQLADYKRPKQIIFRDDPMPRNAANKILKREIKKAYCSLADNT